MQNLLSALESQTSLLANSSISNSSFGNLAQALTMQEIYTTIIEKISQTEPNDPYSNFMKQMIDGNSENAKQIFSAMKSTILPVLLSEPNCTIINDTVIRLMTTNNLDRLAELLQLGVIDVNAQILDAFLINSCQTPEMLQILFEYGLNLEQCCNAQICPMQYISFAMFQLLVEEFDLDVVDWFIRIGDFSTANKDKVNYVNQQVRIKSKEWINVLKEILYFPTTILDLVSHYLYLPPIRLEEDTVDKNSDAKELQTAAPLQVTSQQEITGEEIMRILQQSPDIVQSNPVIQLVQQLSESNPAFVTQAFNDCLETFGIKPNKN